MERRSKNPIHSSKRSSSRGISRKKENQSVAIADSARRVWIALWSALQVMVRDAKVARSVGDVEGANNSYSIYRYRLPTPIIHDYPARYFHPSWPSSEKFAAIDDSRPNKIKRERKRMEELSTRSIYFELSYSIPFELLSFFSTDRLSINKHDVILF